MKYTGVQEQEAEIRAVISKMLETMKHCLPEQLALKGLMSCGAALKLLKAPYNFCSVHTQIRLFSALAGGFGMFTVNNHSICMQADSMENGLWIKKKRKQLPHVQSPTFKAVAELCLKFVFTSVLFWG